MERELEFLVTIGTGLIKWALLAVAAVLVLRLAFVGLISGAVGAAVGHHIAGEKGAMVGAIGCAALAILGDVFGGHGDDQE